MNSFTREYQGFVVFSERRQEEMKRKRNESPLPPPSTSPKRWPSECRRKFSREVSWPGDLHAHQTQPTQPTQPTQQSSVSSTSSRNPLNRLSDEKRKAFTDHFEITDNFGDCKLSSIDLIATIPDIDVVAIGCYINDLVSSRRLVDPGFRMSHSSWGSLKRTVNGVKHKCFRGLRRRIVL